MPLDSSSARTVLELLLSALSGQQGADHGAFGACCSKAHAYSGPPGLPAASLTVLAPAKRFQQQAPAEEAV